jgi:hypothetical protein
MDPATWAFILLGASFAISIAMMPKVVPPQAASFDDFDFPQVEEGTPHAVIFGDCWSGSWMVLDYGDFRTEPIRSGGGKK